MTLAARKPGDPWPESYREMCPRAGRIHFPLEACQHPGGIVKMRAWADVLSNLANTLRELSQMQSAEHKPLWFAKIAIHEANLKIGAYKRGANGL